MLRCAEVLSELDQLIRCKLKRCRYATQMREIEVSKRELGRYAPKKTKTGRSPANAGDLAALHYALENGADLHENERQKMRHYRAIII